MLVVLDLDIHCENSCIEFHTVDPEISEILIFSRRVKN